MVRGLNNVTGIYVDAASGSILRDIEGTEYIDFAGGIGIQNVGHSHPKIVKAIQDQVSKLIHLCFHVTPYGKLYPDGRTIERTDTREFFEKDDVCEQRCGSK